MIKDVLRSGWQGCILALLLPHKSSVIGSQQNWKQKYWSVSERGDLLRNWQVASDDDGDGDGDGDSDGDKVREQLFPPPTFHWETTSCFFFQFDRAEWTNESDIPTSPKVELLETFATHVEQSQMTWSVFPINVG